MPKSRYPHIPADIRDTLLQASLAAQNEPNWPTTAPTDAALLALHNQLKDAISQKAALEAQLAQARAQVGQLAAQGGEQLRRVDKVTNGLYGPDSPAKLNFGLRPIKTTKTPGPPPGQLIIKKITDGKQPASILVSWKPLPGAPVYTLEWALDANFNNPVGSIGLSAHQFEVTGLTRGQQYWFRVRAILGKLVGPWSDPATRVANI